MKVQVKHSSTVEVEAHFPIYRHHGLDHGDYFTCVELADERTGTIKQTTVDLGEDGRVEIEVETGPFDSQSSPEYVLGTGVYSCTPEQFREAAKQALEIATRSLERFIAKDKANS